MAFLEKRAFWLLAVLAGLFAHPICNFLFRCGCVWFSTAHCNIHHATGPRCPWCTQSWPFVLAAACWLAVASLGIMLARRRFGRRAIATLAFGLVGLALGVLLSGAVTIWLTGYPHFIVG
jgi:hypothetical protein